MNIPVRATGIWRWRMARERCTTRMAAAACATEGPGAGERIAWAGLRVGRGNCLSTAIVTGTDFDGIGRATALALAKRGLDIGLTWYASEAGGRETARLVRELGRRACVARLDTSEPEAAARIAGRLADELGGVDVLVNNAGTGHVDSVLDVGIDDWRRVIDTDLIGAFFVAQEAARRCSGWRADGS